MSSSDIVLYVVLALVALTVITTIAKAVRVVPQATAVVVSDPAPPHHFLEGNPTP